MPKKALKRKTSKVIAISKKTRSIWEKSFFAKEQFEFYKTHPNANILIGVFLVSVGLFSLIYVYFNLEAIALAWLI